MDEGDNPKPGKKAKRLLIAVAGLGVGSIAAGAVLHSLGDRFPVALASERMSRTQEMEYVALGRVTVPIVDRDGELVRYVAIDVSLEVPQGTGDKVKAKLPVVLHQINMVTWKSALSSGRDGELVDTGAAEKIFEAAAKQAFGSEVTVNRVLLTSTVPA